FSTFSTSLSAAEVIAFLNEYQRCVVPVIVGAGGVVDKFLGDGVLATFTDPEHRREAAKAFAAVPPLLAAFEAWAQSRAAAGLKTPGFAIAATHGDVVHGLIGGGDRLEFTVIGEAVNLAAKLEKHAKAEKARAIATHDAFALAKAQGLSGEPLRSVSAARVDGVAAPIDLVVLA
ncbi:MAG: adenylate/guanylate cyclase domain-containing protein, partial [Parvularculaceae bacterium]|nr:adenylate/guanylate cyclase domain-containing protein [Parvularculaceae bacterium]